MSTSFVDADGTTRFRGTIVGGAGGALQVATLELTSTWILAHSTDPDIVRLPIVAGDPAVQIVPVGASAFLKFNTTPYTNAETDTDILVGFGSPQGTPLDLFGQPTDLWAATADAVTPLQANGVFFSAGGDLTPGQDLGVYLLGGGLQSGDSPVTVTVLYSTVPLA